MWRIVFRARATNGRAYSSRSTKITAYLRDLSSITRNPIWRLVMALHSPQRLSILEALNASQVPLDDFAHWRSSLYASNIDTAMESTATRTHPSWLVLYLAAFKVRTSQQASETLMDLSFAHLECVPPTIQAPLLVMTMIHLARFDLLSPMQRVIDAFLLVPLPERQNVHFNHLLAAMTAIRNRSPQTGENAVKVLRTMETRQLRLWPSTLSMLLYDRYATLQLTEFLRRRMTGLGIVPSAAQLESYLRVYAANGAIYNVRKYADAIRGYRRTEGSFEEQASAHANSVNRTNTYLVRAQPDSASAFTFLAGLAAPKRRRPSTHPRSVLGKRSVDIHEWTAALSVAAHDRTVNTKKLMRLFRFSRPQTADFRATTVSRTILIRGLLLRRQWELAYVVWTRLATSGLAIDELALTTGMQAATLSGRPAEAFTLLEKYGALPGALHSSSTYRLLRPVKVTTGLINRFMISLHNVLRPDLVFRLWDAMGELYNVRPSAETLRIVLEAAQLPHTLDDSFRGEFALLALKNPFRHPPARPATRAALAASLTTHAAQPYRSGVWRDRPAVDAAAHLFLQAALGTPERLHLASLSPPACAVRPYTESDSAAPTIQLTMRPPRFELPPDMLTPTGRAHFPEIVLRDRDFRAYVVLLGMTKRAPEIARALVWMCGVGVQPSLETLGLALAFWSEVSVQPPLIAAIVGPAGDEYLKLVTWLKGWCKEVPDAEVVGQWRYRIGRVRAQRRNMAGKPKFLEEDPIWGMRM